MSWRDRAIKVTESEPTRTSSWRERAIPVNETPQNVKDAQDQIKSLEASGVDPVIIQAQKNRLGFLKEGKTPPFALRPLQQSFDIAGEKTTEKLTGMGVPTPISAVAGTAVAMTPDIVSLAFPSGPELKGFKSLDSGAKGFARRALGFSKSQLKTPFARGQAAKAAEVALEEGIIPALGNRQEMARRAGELMSRSGQEIGKIRESVGPQKIDAVFNSLEDLRSEIVKGRTGGVWDDISKKIDKAQESILGLVNKNEKVSLKDVEETKKAISDTVNFLSDNASQKTTKKIASSIEKGVERVLVDNGADIKRYKTAKQKFGAAKKMMEGIDNAVSAETGNNLFGPISSITGIAQAASGNIPGAATSLGLVELMKRRGSSTVANLLDFLAKKPAFRGELSSPLVGLVLKSLVSPSNRE